MTVYTHTLTEIERLCGVTLEDVAETLPRVLVRNDRVIMPENTGPALATSVARCALGKSAGYVGTNSLGLDVYMAT